MTKPLAPRHRRYVDPPTGERCDASIRLPDRSPARCGRRVLRGETRCWQHRLTQVSRPPAPRDGYPAPHHHPSPIRLKARVLGKMEIRVDYRAGELPVISKRSALLTGRGPATVMIAADRPLRIHTLFEKGCGVLKTDLPEELQQVADFLHRAPVHPGQRVLVGGLGLGIVATILAAQYAADVTVVERSGHVVKLVSSKQSPFRVVRSDIFKYLSRCDPFDAYYLDTWSGTNESTWWNEVLPLRRLIGQRFGRAPVYCWAEYIMLGQIRRSIETMHAERTAGRKVYWNYTRLPKTTDADEFLGPDVGTARWEQKYGPGLDWPAAPI